jgi:hypothetical protein
MRRKTTITCLFSASLVALALAASGSVAPAAAVTPSQLESHGWSCIAPSQIVPGATDDPHCARSRGLARFFIGEARTLKMLVFDSSDQTFLGTEFNIRGDIFRRGDIFHDQPCPTDPPDYEYTHLLETFGLDYYACHRFDSDHLDHP